MKKKELNESKVPARSWFTGLPVAYGPPRSATVPLPIPSSRSPPFPTFLPRPGEFLLDSGAQPYHMPKPYLDERLETSRVPHSLSSNGGRPLMISSRSTGVEMNMKNIQGCPEKPVSGRGLSCFFGRVINCEDLERAILSVDDGRIAANSHEYNFKTDNCTNSIHMPHQQLPNHDHEHNSYPSIQSLEEYIRKLGLEGSVEDSEDYSTTSERKPRKKKNRSKKAARAEKKQRLKASTIDNLDPPDALRDSESIDHVPKKSKSKKKKKHILFDEYESIEDVKIGLELKTHILGEFRMDKNNLHTAYVTDPDEENDICIEGKMDRNRAFNSDKVIIKIKEESLWKKPGKQTKTEMNSEPVKPMKTGKVVYIMEKVHPRTCVGSLIKGLTKCVFNPRDLRVPSVTVPNSSLPLGVYDRLDNLNDMLFKVRITDWNNCKSAEGVVEEEIGRTGQIETETVAALYELGLDCNSVPESLYKYIQKIPFVIPQEEIDLRMDLRNELVFSIDPESARDLDDAVSVKSIEHDLYEVGVHISDVSYFLEYGTPLDEFVASRATTIYLVDKAIHMLPLSLCMLCSLLPAEDKLSISVIWKMDIKGNIFEKTIRRSVINSCAQLSYEHAQDVIEDKPVDLPLKRSDFSQDQVKSAIKILHEISANLFRKRKSEGTLKINQSKPFIKLNQNGEPIHLGTYNLKESNSLIEQFMLQANITVAERIHSERPDIALLRRHNDPNRRILKSLKTELSSIGIDLDIDSCKALDASIEKAIAKHPEFQVPLYSRLVRSMKRAEYFCCSEDTHHYALNFELYTHFTSPIRRYSDIVVHRLLTGILEYNDIPPWTTDHILQFASTSNSKKHAASEAGKISCELYLGYYIRLTGDIFVDAVVIKVMSQNTFQAIIGEYGLTVRVCTNSWKDLKDNAADHVYNSGSCLETAHMKMDSTPVDIQLFSTVKLKLSVKSDSLAIIAELATS